MEIRYLSQAAPGRANEDLAFAVNGLVGVFDGVTQPAGLDVGCRHTPAWYVRQLAARLTAERFQQPTAALTEVLSKAIARVRGDHGPQCDLSHPGTPAASVTLLELRDGRVDYLVLCDTLLVLDEGNQPTLVADGRFERTVAELRREALVPGTLGSEAHADRIAQTTVKKWELTNQVNGYWIAAANPQAAFEAVTGTVDAGNLRRAALLTDGASCAVDQFNLFDWTGMLDLLEADGPAELIRHVRRAESADVDGSTQPRYKRHDDATAALCLFDVKEDS